MYPDVWDVNYSTDEEEEIIEYYSHVPIDYIDKTSTIPKIESDTTSGENIYTGLGEEKYKNKLVLVSSTSIPWDRSKENLRQQQAYTQTKKRYRNYIRGSRGRKNVKFHYQGHVQFNKVNVYEHLERKGAIGRAISQQRLDEEKREQKRKWAEVSGYNSESDEVELEYSIDRPNCKVLKVRNLKYPSPCSELLLEPTSDDQLKDGWEKRDSEYKWDKYQYLPAKGKSILKVRKVPYLNIINEKLPIITRELGGSRELTEFSELYAWVKRFFVPGFVTRESIDLVRPTYTRYLDTTLGDRLFVDKRVPDTKHTTYRENNFR